MTKEQSAENNAVMNKLIFGHSPPVTCEVFEKLESYPGNATAVPGQMYKFQDFVMMKLTDTTARFYSVVD
jgi:hypothetical protein